jgi:hypothetical protein
MARPTPHELTHLARSAGYQMIELTQLRANRWLMLLLAPSGEQTLVMVQARPLVGATDVQDLAEVVRLRRPTHSILLALGGAFSVAAQQTVIELGEPKMRLCTVLPPVKADLAEVIDLPVLGTALKQVR